MKFTVVIEFKKLLLYIEKKGGIAMLKFLAKVAEKYAKSANTACLLLGLIHQPKMPDSMIKRD